MKLWFIENAIYFLAVIGIIFNFYWLFSFRDKLKLKPVILFFTAVIYAAADYLFVKIFAVIEYLDISAFSSMSLFGAVFFMPPAIAAIARSEGVKPSLLLDISTPGQIFFFMCGRINCLISGCCYGTYLGENFRWPVREAEITLYIILITVFCIRLRHGKFTGGYYALFLIVYGIFRFAVEFVRYFPDQTGLWHRGHLFAVIALAAGTVWFVFIRRKKRAESVRQSA